MYSEQVTAKHLEKVEASLGIKLHRYTIAESHELTAYLTKLHKDGKLQSNGRYHNKDHAAFIRNEQILFQQDFFYALRYIEIIKDGVEGGGIGYFRIWESQKILMELIAKSEEQNIDFYEKGYPCDGILICDNKGGRQLGHTMIGRAIVMHRFLSWPYTRSIAASIDEDKVQELYDRDRLIIDNLPFFLKPVGWGTTEGGYDKKGEHIHVESLGSKILYQQSKQQSGIGTGRQFDTAHLTEVSQWPYPGRIEMDFFPTLPQHPYTFALLETTPYGRGNFWHDFSERVRKNKMPRWKYLFIPWYCEPKKYRRHMPDDWQPNDQTLQMAWKVHQTSKEWVGKEVTLDREHLGWWETSYSEAMENNSLNLFLSNFSITPEMGFQHTSRSAVSTEILDWLRTGASEGIAYELEGL